MVWFSSTLSSKHPSSWKSKTDETKPLQANFSAGEYDVEKRDEIYASWSFDGWAGRSGHDAPMIAYDALLASGSDWEELCRRATFHAGKDSVGGLHLVIRR